jgi:PEGA domain
LSAPGDLRFAALFDGCTMRKIVVVAASLGLAGCSSFSTPEMFKSAPPTVAIQLESQPAGAEARTSGGQTCQTPCSLSIPVEGDFTVTFSLPKYTPETVPVQVVRQQQDGLTGSAIPATVDPNPVYAELQLAPPPGRKSRPKAAAPRPRKPKATPAAAAPAEAPPPPAPADSGSPFPPPPAR